jgi:hypothetical protein
VATALQAAFTPWILARQLPSRPAVLMPAIFLGLCMVVGMAPLPLVWDQHEFLLPWAIGVSCHVLLSTICFGLLLPPWRVRHVSGSVRGDAYTTTVVASTIHGSTLPIRSRTVT